MAISGNPAINEGTFTGLPHVAEGSEAMSMEGTVNKSAVLFGLLVLSASVTWKMVLDGNEQGAWQWAIGGIIGGFVVALLTIWVKSLTPYTAPIYSILEGLALGGISAGMEAEYPGIVTQAVGLTFGTMLCMLVAYATGAIQVTAKLRLGVVAATGGIAIVYLVTFALEFMGVPVSFIHDNSLFGIGFNVFVVGIAAFNLVLDFDFIQMGIAQQAPKYMEWYAGFALMVTLVWLYLEILRLLGKMRK